jgi:hypothetical protein
VINLAAPRGLGGERSRATGATAPTGDRVAIVIHQRPPGGATELCMHTIILRSIRTIPVMPRATGLKAPPAGSAGLVIPGRLALQAKRLDERIA